MNIPNEDLPLAVLSYNYRSFISTAITIRESGSYNHFMWMHEPGKFATQDWWFREIKAEKYLKHHRLKFWYDPAWSNTQKILIKERIYAELSKPKWKTRYDLLAIFGQLIGITGIQIPWTKICSDHAKYISIIDPRYNLEHPDPEDVNQWLKNHPNYFVYGRFSND